MADAPSLRAAAEVAPAHPGRAVARARRVVAVGGGKGGIGKTLVSTNLAIELARRGESVVLLDADLGGANLHTALGLTEPKRSLSDFILRRVTRLEEVWIETGIPNLRLVSGALDSLDAANPKYDQKIRLMRHIRARPADTVVLDLGAGTHVHTLDLFLLADHGVLVLVPEPTAVENVYRFVKAAFWRRVRNVVAVGGVEPLLRAVMGEGAYRSPAEVIAALSSRHPEAGRELSRQLDLFRPRLVVNQTRTPQDAKVGDAVVAAWRKFFGLKMDYLGDIQYESDMWRSMRARKPWLVQDPSGAGARSFARIADALAALEPTGRRETEP